MILVAILGPDQVEVPSVALNMLAQFVPFGIYTPMHFTVTCASGEDQEDRSGEPFLVPLR